MMSSSGLLVRRGVERQRRFAGEDADFPLLLGLELPGQDVGGGACESDAEAARGGDWGQFGGDVFFRVWRGVSGGFYGLSAPASLLANGFVQRDAAVREGDCSDDY